MYIDYSRCFQDERFFYELQLFHNSIGNSYPLNLGYIQNINISPFYAWDEMLKVHTIQINCRGNMPPIHETYPQPPHVQIDVIFDTPFDSIAPVRLHLFLNGLLQSHDASHSLPINE